MSDETADPLTPAQERVRALLVPFHEATAPEDLTGSVSRTARWQRPLRRVLVAVGHVSGAIGGGIASLFRTGNRR